MLKLNSNSTVHIAADTAIRDKYYTALIEKEINNAFKQVLPGVSFTDKKNEASFCIKVRLDCKNKDIQPYQYENYFSPKEERFTILIEGENVSIAGEHPMGLVFGAYYFISNFLGLRWIFPGAEGVFGQKKDFIEIPDCNISQSPSFSIRWLQCEPSHYHSKSSSAGDIEKVSLWALRNFFNINIKIGGNLYGKHILGRFHEMQRFISDEFIAGHPECLALADNQRKQLLNIDGKNRTQYCWSYPPLMNEVAQNVIAYMKKHPHYFMVDLTPNDSSRFCECKTCREFMSRITGSGKPESSIYNYFCRETAKIISRQLPDVYIKTGAYANYLAKPDPEFLPEKKHAVHVARCSSTRICYNHPLEKCTLNRTFLDELKSWTASSSEVIMYEYYYKHSWVELPWPLSSVIASDLRTYRETGAAGVYTQYSLKNHDNLFKNYFVMSRRLWNANRDYSEIENELYESIFPNAKKYMEKYYLLLETIFRDTDIHIIKTPLFLDKIISSNTLKRLNELLEQAFEKASGKEQDVILNIKRYYKYLAASCCYVQELRNDTGRLQEALEEVKEYFPNEIENPYVSNFQNPERYIEWLGRMEKLGMV